MKKETRDAMIDSALESISDNEVMEFQVISE